MRAAGMEVRRSQGDSRTGNVLEAAVGGLAALLVLARFPTFGLSFAIAWVQSSCISRRFLGTIIDNFSLLSV